MGVRKKSQEKFKSDLGDCLAFQWEKLQTPRGRGRAILECLYCRLEFICDGIFCESSNMQKNTIANNFDSYIAFIVVVNFRKHFSITNIFPSRFPGIFANIFQHKIILIYSNCWLSKSGQLPILNKGQTAANSSIAGIGPDLSTENLLQSIAAALHTANQPVVGQSQSSSKFLKNPTVHINTGQPLVMVCVSQYHSIVLLPSLSLSLPLSLSFLLENAVVPWFGTMVQHRCLSLPIFDREAMIEVTDARRWLRRRTRGYDWGDGREEMIEETDARRGLRWRTRGDDWGDGRELGLLLKLGDYIWVGKYHSLSERSPLVSSNSRSCSRSAIQFQAALTPVQTADCNGSSDNLTLFSVGFSSAVGEFLLRIVCLSVCCGKIET